ncbi:MAG: rhodanese-like domain-containing protein [Candidatus Moranbacteria bacterium]|nr:rhodanese-like domain-containing protein [Candidatus Moranbacteria bacterium]
MSFLIDVRTQEEFKERHAPGALNIPVDEICAGKLGILEGIQKSTPLKLYCRSGKRSETAKEVLGLLGFTDVTNLGGLDDIKNA